MEKNYKNESMVDVAHDILTDAKRIMNFSELYMKVCDVLGLDDDTKVNKISSFYTNLSLDGRFVNLGNNEWDLREHQKSENIRKLNEVTDEMYDDQESESKANIDVEEYDEAERKAEGLDDEDDEETNPGEEDY